MVTDKLCRWYYGPFLGLRATRYKFVEVGQAFEKGKNKQRQEHLQDDHEKEGRRMSGLLVKDLREVSKVGITSKMDPSFAIDKRENSSDSPECRCGEHLWHVDSDSHAHKYSAMRDVREDESYTI
jgi:hypothetical protein